MRHRADAAETVPWHRRRPYEASTYYEDAAFGPAVKVMPGEYRVGGEHAIVTTLGSCVSACLHDPGAGVAGLNHFILAEGGTAADGARYGAFAMELLLARLQECGARPSALHAKLFGGGCVMQSLRGTLIGEKNVAFARAWLERAGIPLVASDVLDVFPRRICLLPRTGQVLCRRLPAADMAAI